MWWTTARSLPRSTISPISNSSSGAARTSCGTVRFPLLTENLTRTRSTRFAQTVPTSFARAAATRRPSASSAVPSIRESPRSSASPTATFSSGANSRDVRSDLSSQDTMSAISIRFGSRVPTVDRRPLRGSQDSLELGGRGEVRNRLDRDETAPAAPQGEAHEERRRREPEDEGAHVGLPGDSEWPEESEEGLQNEEDDHHFDDRQRWDSRDRQE